MSTCTSCISCNPVRAGEVNLVEGLNTIIFQENGEDSSYKNKQYILTTSNISGSAIQILTDLNRSDGFTINCETVQGDGLFYYSAQIIT